MHFLRRLGKRIAPDSKPRAASEREVLIAGYLSEPEARLWAEALQREGVPSLVKSIGPLEGELSYGSTDYTIWTLERHEEQAEAIIARQGGAGRGRRR